MQLNYVRTVGELSYDDSQIGIPFYFQSDVIRSPLTIVLTSISQNN